MPSTLSSPMEFFGALTMRYEAVATSTELTEEAKEKIMIKILAILKCWATCESAHCDFSGAVIQEGLDFTRRVMEDQALPETVSRVCRKVSWILADLHSDLVNLEHAQVLHAERMQQYGLIKAELPAALPAAPATGDAESPALEREWRTSEHEQYLGSSPLTSVGLNARDQLNSRDSADGSSRDSLASISLGADKQLNMLADLYLEEDEQDDNHDGNGGDKHRRGSLFQYRRAGGTSDGPKKDNPPSPRGQPKVSDTPATANKSHATSSSTPSMASVSGSTPRTPRTIKPSSDSPPYVKSVPYGKLCECLTVMEQEEGIMSVRPREFVDMLWTKGTSKRVHPDLGGAANLNRAILSTNQKIAWVARQVIEYASCYGSTSEAIEYFIRVGRSALQCNNFNTLFEITSALGKPPRQ